jgi:hypothetical protein
MIKNIFTAVLILLIGFSTTATAATQCDAQAIVQAKKLLSFHSDNDERIEIMPEVKKLHSMANPANKKQTFIVLEVMGYIYKGNYRMRFIYYPLGEDCVLMGQEILELAIL